MTALCILLAAAAAWFAVPQPKEPRLRRLNPDRRDRSVRRPGRVTAGAAAGRAAGVIAGVGAWVLLGGVPGLALGLFAAVGLPRGLSMLETRDDRDRREQLDRQAPLLADLLSATLAAGAPMRGALEVVAAAVGEPTAGSLRPVLAAIDLGAVPAEAWQGADPPPAHQPILDALARSGESGAPLSTQLARVAEDMRRERMRNVQVRARSAGVRAVAPLAACFLPAFVLVGVVPVVASLAGALL